MREVKLTLSEVGMRPQEALSYALVKAKRLKPHSFGTLYMDPDDDRAVFVEDGEPLNVQPKSKLRSRGAAGKRGNASAPKKRGK